MSYSMYKIKTEGFSIINYIYLIVDNETRDAAVIDPSWEADKFFAMLDSLDVRLTSVFITHSHFDHMYMLKKLLKRYGDLNIYISKIEYDYYSPDGRFLTLDDRDIVMIGETAVKGILTPGHTKGSMCYLLEDRIFTGDTLFTEGCGTCFGKGADAYEMYESMRLLLRLLDDEVRVYPAHSFGREGGEKFGILKKLNIYLQFDNKELFVKFRNRPGQKGIFSFK